MVVQEGYRKKLAAKRHGTFSMFLPTISPPTVQEASFVDMTDLRRKSEPTTPTPTTADSFTFWGEDTHDSNRISRLFGMTEYTPIIRPRNRCRWVWVWERHKSTIFERMRSGPLRWFQRRTHLSLTTLGGRLFLYCLRNLLNKQTYLRELVIQNCHLQYHEKTVSLVLRTAHLIHNQASDRKLAAGLLFLPDPLCLPSILPSGEADFYCRSTYCCSSSKLYRM
jgi:hypothetical protein